MKRILANAACAVLVAATVWGAAAQEGFKPLFNGKDLAGWQGGPGLWRVENGEIVGSTHGVDLKQNTFLFYDQEFTDFELKASFKLINGNSGIQFRSERRPDFVAAGYQADLAEKEYTGMLYEERKRGILPYWEALPPEKRAHFDKELFKRNDWNDFSIRTQGDQIVMTLNGEITCELTDPDGAKRGYIALQLHVGPPMEVRFRDISIRDLSVADMTASKPGAAAPTKKMGPQTFASTPPAPDELLMPDVDKSRSEKLGLTGERFRTPEGFVVEEVATDELIGSIINMTFDHKGRPALGAQEKGIWLLDDTDGDGVYDKKHAYTEAVQTTMGMYYLGAGDLLVQADGPDGPGLYRLLDKDGDDVAEEVVRIQRSDAGMGEHGPHTIERGPDGFLYIMYGNHAHPLREANAASPYRGYKEDFLLPRYVDPRGHATDIMAPGGTFHRVNPDFTKDDWREVAGGFRNAYDYSMNMVGEIFTYDSDMEWDFGLPWYRPVRVAHVVQGADYGWRTGSSTMPFYYFDTLPSIDDIGRGSPVGTAFYYHYTYPEKFSGAYFMGDWSRGRIRVMFPKPAGASYSGKSLDFVLGEPLNVTDLDVGPDGNLYFTNGGRSTHGGMYRVRYTGGEPWKTPSHPVVDQPQPRSAWGQAALLKAKEEMGRARWRGELNGIVADAARPAIDRLRALEAMQIHGPKPRVEELDALLDDSDPALRAQAVYLLGASEDEVDLAVIASVLKDSDPFVIRRACEALVRRIGQGPAPADAAVVETLLAHLDHADVFVRYAARLALQRIDKAGWKSAVLDADFATQPQRVLTGMLAIVLEAPTCEDSQAVVAKLATLPAMDMPEALLLDYTRLIQLAVIRNACETADYAALTDVLLPALIQRFPSEDYRMNREMQVLLAHFQEAAAISPMLDHLTEDLPQEEQVHTVYCLRAIKDGWTKQQRQELIEWFDRGRELGGGASFEGYINNLWASMLETMPGPEQEVAKLRQERALRKQREEAAALVAAAGKPDGSAGELMQMSFAELSEYLEYDPMAYREPDLKRGEAIFIKAKCAACHVFGSVGKGGGPDLSTVAARFRRGDLLDAIMYPSKVVSDQYIGVEATTKDGAKFLGILAGENDTTLTMITAYGDRVEIAKDNIAEQKPATASIMPEGLLNTLSQDELVCLVQYLEHGAQ